MVRVMTALDEQVRAALLALLLAVSATVAHGQTNTDAVSFAGKQIKLLIGYSPTGYGYDTYGRLLARHLGKYLVLCQARTQSARI